MKSFIEKTHQWLQRRLRIYIWKSWKWIGRNLLIYNDVVSVNIEHDDGQTFGKAIGV